MKTTLFILTKDMGEPNEKSRLKTFPNWSVATGEVLQWGGKSPVRLAEITEAMAKKLYPKLVIEK